MKTYIYLLTDGIYYYIGKANDPKDRFIKHCSEALRKTGTPKRDWLKKRINQGKRGLIRDNLQILEEISESSWKEREIHWITHYRKLYGTQYVLNVTDGGDGGNTVSGETHPNVTLSDEEVLDAAELYLNSDLTISQVAEKYNTSFSGLQHIFSGYTRKYLGLNIQTHHLDETPLLDDYDLGSSIGDLSEKYQMSKKMVRHYLRKHGYSAPFTR